MFNLLLTQTPVPSVCPLSTCSKVLCVESKEGEVEEEVEVGSFNTKPINKDSRGDSRQELRVPT